MKIKSGSNENVMVDNIEYEPDGGIKRYRYANGIITEVGRDLRGAINGIVSGEVMNRSYVRDGVGNILSISDILDNQRNQVFGYDGLYRLTTATGVYGNQNFSYDNSGNRISAYNGNYSYQSGTNRLLSLSGSENISFEYDSNGNITSENAKQYVYNSLDRLVEYKENGNTISRYRYDYRDLSRFLCLKSGIEHLHYFIPR